MRVAVVEDEKRFAEALKKGLESESYTVDLFVDGASAREKLEYSGNTYDLVILDLMLPDEDGAAVCTHLRNTGVLSPILVLTARDGIEDKIDLFDRGADDFLTKPFEFEELLARSRALARRTALKEQRTLHLSDLVIVPDERVVTRDGKKIRLTPREFELLVYLVRERGRVISREELLAKVWKLADEEVGNVVDVHMRNLRKKIGGTNNDKYIHTVHGVGYTVAQ